MSEEVDVFSCHDFFFFNGRRRGSCKSVLYLDLLDLTSIYRRDLMLFKKGRLIKSTENS